MASDTTERSVPAGNRPERAAGQPPRGTVIVLDDDRSFRLGVARALRGEGFVVHEAEDTAELAKLLDVVHADVVLADSRLADGSDGWREAVALAARFPRTKVVPVTGYDADAIEAVEGTILPGFVRKGSSAYDVLQAIMDAMRA